jgi:hypothetical protein
MKKLSLFIALAFVMQSCICVHVIGRKTHFMRDLTDEQKNNVCWTTDSISLIGMKNDNRIYAINAHQMKELLKTNEKAVIYQWSPHCSSENCTSLGLTQSYCDEKGIELYVVIDYYADAFSQIESIRNPLLSISERHYNTELAQELREIFYKELLGDKYDKKNYSRFYYFENGEFLKTYNSINNLQ